MIGFLNILHLFHNHISAKEEDMWSYISSSPFVWQKRGVKRNEECFKKPSLVGRRDGPAEGDGELGRDERVLLVVRDERVERVEEDLEPIV